MLVELWLGTSADAFEVIAVDITPNGVEVLLRQGKVLRSHARSAADAREIWSSATQKINMARDLQRGKRG